MLDCIIVGSGPAGLSAAINLKTFKKAFVWFGSKILSDKLIKSEKIVNYPGFPEITGEELSDRFHEHIKSAGLEIIEKTVTMIVKSGEHYMVLADNDIYEARTVIVSTGVMTARLLENETEFIGRGVSYCATCDGNLYKGKRIAVICNSEKYEHEVEFLASLASEVLYYPSFKSSLEGANIQKSINLPTKISGDLRANAITLRNGKEEKVDGIFCLRNSIAPSTLIKGIEIIDGHISVDRRMGTNMPGLFACGDCTGRPYQLTKAVGEGNVAAHSVIEFLAGK